MYTLTLFQQQNLYNKMKKDTLIIQHNSYTHISRFILKFRQNARNLQFKQAKVVLKPPQD